MKRFLSFTLFMILMFSIGGCNEAVIEETSNTDSKTQNNMSGIATIKDYYPFEENKTMKYKGIGNEYAEMETFVEFIEEDTIQIKTINAGTNFVNVVELKDGVLTEVFGEGEFYHIENMINTNRNIDNIILKEPIQVGNSWQDGEGNKVEITGIDKLIDTPLKKYEALEVTTNYKGNASKKDYYVKGVGFVASIYEDGEFEVKTLLEKIEDKGISTNIKVYYPTSEDIGSKYIMKEINFKTNNNIKATLERLLKNPKSDKLLAAIPEDASIKRINLNRDNWNLEVDLSKEFNSEMNAGSTSEIEIINSIVNTLGNYYDVERVYITVEGQPYQSGHLQLLENEYFEVNTKDIEELKINN